MRKGGIAVKRIWWLPLALLLAGCGAEQAEVSGRVTAARAENGQLVYLEVHDYGTGTDTPVYVTEETTAVSWTEEVTAEDFLAGEGITSARVTAECSVKSGKCFAREITVYGTMRQTGSLTLSDGTEVGVWAEDGGTSYRLSDGTELLREEPAQGPWDVYGGGEVFESLPYDVRRAVAVWYRGQGTLYDVEEELERIWAAEGAHAGERHHLVSQETGLTAASPRVLYFRTSAVVPAFSGTEDGPTVETRERNAAFDRETGEKLDAWSLFTVPEAEARAALLDKMADGDADLRAEMAAALEPEHLGFRADVLEVAFPRGALPSREHAAVWGFAYEELDGLLQPWAVPEEPAA